jgi:hypothetical protein
MHELQYYYYLRQMSKVGRDSMPTFEVKLRKEKRIAKGGSIKIYL